MNTSFMRFRIKWETNMTIMKIKLLRVNINHKGSCKFGKITKSQRLV
eukprot:UN15853